MGDESLDIEQFPALLGYLRGTGRIGAAEEPEVTRLAGGVSNRTVLLRRASGEEWVLKQALPKLRVAVEWLSDPIRIVREAEGMAALSELTQGAVPRLIFLDREKHLLAMDAVPQPHANFKSLLLHGTIESDHFRQFGTMLGRIQRGGWLGRDVFSVQFADRQFFESLRLEPYYLYTAERCDSDAAAFLRALVAQTRATRHTLVHGDYSPKNVLVYCGRLILLDHEVIHFGDGAFDVGFSLAHILSKAHHFPQQRAILANMAVIYWNAYRDALGEAPWGDDLAGRSVQHALGCLLARCIGRSPLEYLSAEERRRQSAAVVKILRRPPGAPPALVGEFLEMIDADD